MRIMSANNDPKINDFPNSILTFLMQSNCYSLFHSISLSPFSSWFWLVRIFSFVISKTETHTITFWINISHTKRTLHSVKICRVYIRSHHSLISVLIFGKILNFLPFSKFAAEADESEIDACVELQLLMRCEPNMMHPPLVDFLVRMHPAQSASE